MVGVEEELSGSFDYALTFTESSTYKPEDEVWSPTVLVGTCPVGLVVFPAGRKSSTRNCVSAYVHVRPRANWEDAWAFPDVRYTITVRNAAGKGDEVNFCTGTFTGKSPSRGWPEMMVDCAGYAGLRHGGWIFADDTLRFHVTLQGSSLGQSKRRMPEEKHHLARLWQDMKFPDMHICAGDGAAELPCHRAILATASPVLDRMLTSSMKEGFERRLALPHTSVKAAQGLLEYIYTGSNSEEALLDVQVLRDLLPLADQYELTELLGQCASSLVEVMSPANVCDVLAVLRTYQENPRVVDHFRKAKKAARQDGAMFEALVESLRTPSPFDAGDRGEPRQAGLDEA